MPAYGGQMSTLTPPLSWQSGQSRPPFFGRLAINIWNAHALHCFQMNA
jgi:hypothetical protein